MFPCDGNAGTLLFAGLSEKPDEPSPPLPPDPKELAAIVGEYRHCELVFKYSVRSGKLLREFQGEQTVFERRAPFYYESDDGLDAVFLRDASGKVAYVHSDLLSAKKRPS